MSRVRYQVNTRKMKSEIRRQLPKKYQSIATSYAALNVVQSGNRDLPNLLIN